MSSSIRKRVVVLIGQRRTGKTAALLRLARHSKHVVVVSQDKLPKRFRDLYSHELSDLAATTSVEPTVIEGRDLASTLTTTTDRPTAVIFTDLQIGVGTDAALSMLPLARLSVQANVTVFAEITAWGRRHQTDMLKATTGPRIAGLGIPPFDASGQAGHIVTFPSVAFIEAVAASLVAESGSSPSIGRLISTAEGKWT